MPEVRDYPRLQAIRDFATTAVLDLHRAFTGLALRDKPGAKLWSKAGWTSQTRHDAAYIELSNGVRFVLVTFTTDHANERGIIESVAKKMIEALSR